MSKYYEIQAEVDRLPDAIGDRLLTTKQELLWDIRDRRDKILSSISNSNRHTTRYYSVMEALLDQFYAIVKKTVLPNRLEDWWFYSYEISYKGIALFLEHMESAFMNEEMTEASSETMDQIFVLLFIPAKMLSVEEYSKLYEVEPVTVRQWIRRCKLRTVTKAGKEWRISELTDIPKRGFEPAQYRWRAELTDLPSGFEYLNEYKQATLGKKNDNSGYWVLFSEANGTNSKTRSVDLNNEERETLETFFIGNDNVQYASESLSYFWKIKKEDEEDGE